MIQFLFLKAKPTFVTLVIPRILLPDYLQMLGTATVFLATRTAPRPATARALVHGHRRMTWSLSLTTVALPQLIVARVVKVLLPDKPAILGTEVRPMLLATLAPRPLHLTVSATNGPNTLDRHPELPRSLKPVGCPTAKHRTQSGLLVGVNLIIEQRQPEQLAQHLFAAEPIILVALAPVVTLAFLTRHVRLDLPLPQMILPRQASIARVALVATGDFILLGLTVAILFAPGLLA